MRKCKYCGALLSYTNSVFIHISRFDYKGKSSNSHWICCKCWDDTRIQLPYIEEDKIPKQDDVRTCGNCNHLIFKDYKERTGSCRLTRLYRRFSDICVNDEDMRGPH